jgi:hypothetical protein
MNKTQHMTSKKITKTAGYDGNAEPMGDIPLPRPTPPVPRPPRSIPVALRVCRRQARLAL